MIKAQKVLTIIGMILVAVYCLIGILLWSVTFAKIQNMLSVLTLKAYLKTFALIASKS